MTRAPLLAALALSAAALTPVRAQEAPPVEAVNTAIDRGVQYLVSMQEADGSWGSDTATSPGTPAGARRP